MRVLPRRTALARARLNCDEHKGVHVIAANVDVVAVCAPLDRPLSQRFLERGIALAHASGALVAADVLRRAVQISAAHRPQRSERGLKRPDMGISMGHRGSDVDRAEGP